MMTGNLRSIKAACDKVDLKSIITNDTEIIMNSKSLCARCWSV